MNFSEALINLKNLNKIRRKCWGDGVHLRYDYTNKTILLIVPKFNKEGFIVDILGEIDYNGDGFISQDDLLAEDWEILY